MGKNITDLNQCKKKIRSIYALINSKLNIQKIILATRMSYMYNIGFGKVDGGNIHYNYYLEGFFKNKQEYNHKEMFFNTIEKTFEYFQNNKTIDFYYLMDNPELGFEPSSKCLLRPFNIFKNDCLLPLESYMNRAGEYRSFIYELSKKYNNINILDPKNLYCDDKYCYVIKDDKMLYADNNHHSVDGSIKQAKFFIDKMINK